MPVPDLLPYALPGAGQEVRLVLGRYDVGGDRGAAGGQLVEDGGLQVPEDGHRDRARDRGRGHHQQVRGLLPLGPQRVALLHAEAVLFVDHDQAEVVELHLVLDERVRADHDAGLSGDQVEQGLAARGHPHGTGEQHDLGALVGAAEHPSFGELAHHLGDGAVVLLGEHLGGGQHGGLPAAVDDGEHGPQRHHRLPTADLALQEAVHGVFGGQVVEDLLRDGLLALGEGEGELGVEGVEQAAGSGAARDGRELGVGVPAAGQRDLEDEGLVPLQPLPGVVDVGLGARPVDLQQGLGEGDQSAALAQCVRQRVHGLMGAGQYGVHAFGDLPGLQLGAGRVDRDQLVREGGGGVPVGGVRPERLVRGVGELELAVEHADLAREHGAGARQQVLVGLVDARPEEDQLEAAAAVGDGHLQAFAAAPVERQDPGVGDLGDHRHVLVDLVRELRQGGQLPALGVPPRVVVEQVQGRVQAELLGQHLGGGGAERLLEVFVERGHVFIAHHRADKPAIRPR